MKFEISSTLKSNSTLVAEQCFLMDGVNYELSPFLKMTCPNEWSNRPIIEWPVEERLFTSVILLFGIVPIDLHRFYLLTANDGGFNEDSSSLMNKHWRHSRSIVSSNGSCKVTDSVEFVSRLSFLEYFMKPIYAIIFKKRHNKLREKYGIHC